MEETIRRGLRREVKYHGVEEIECVVRLLLLRLRLLLYAGFIWPVLVGGYYYWADGRNHARSGSVGVFFMIPHQVAPTSFSCAFNKRPMPFVLGFSNILIVSKDEHQ